MNSKLLIYAVCVGLGWPIGVLGQPATTPNQNPPLSPEASLAAFRLPPGFQIRLVAAEPDLVNPMTMTLDDEGHIYVSLAHTYRYGPKGAPVESPSNPVVRLELNSEGRAERRTEVVSGFADPVMGLAVRDGQLWATNLNEVFKAKLNENGVAGDRQTLVRDAETPWNPFGMYRVAFGPNGLVYLCVGDHPTKLSGPNNQVAVRGSTGAVFRFKPDGSDIELLVQGMRAPFSFDIDPFGRIWVLSNGEGNPNRLIHAISGGDYHFQTRAVDWAWLAGDHPWSPPVWENPPGAHTTVLAYHSSAFPSDYWGSLLVPNWGVHGFPSANHVILRHRMDERGNRIETLPFLTTTDARFRPTQIALAPDGNLYVLDWYGMDDENDLTGRLYKISYVAPEPGGSAIGGGLGSRNHWERRRAKRELLERGPEAADELTRTLREPDALSAAESLWVLRQSGVPNAASIMEAGLRHSDWRVRRLAVELIREMGPSPALFEKLVDDPDAEVRLEAAIGLAATPSRLEGVMKSLRAGGAESRRLRYRAALEFARLGTSTDFETLLTDADSDVQLAGVIAIDEAFHEGSRAEGAREALVRLITVPRGAPLGELLAIADRWPHASLEGPVTLALSHDLSAQEMIRGVTVLRRLRPAVAASGPDSITTPATPANPATPNAWDGILDRFWSRAARGEVRLASSAEKLAVLAILAMDRPQPDTVAVLGDLARDDDPEVRAEAHHVLTTIGIGNAACVDWCWRLLHTSETPLEIQLETIVSLAQIEPRLASDEWLRLLESPTSKLALVALRSLRNHADQGAVTGLLERTRARLASRGASFESALLVREQFPAIVPGSQQVLAQLYAEEKDPRAVERKERLRGSLIERHAEGDPILGRLVFRSQVCHRCHRSGGQAEFAGPPLEGVAATNTVDYLIDSILFPSKTIKTGFMLELVVTQDGRTLVGGVAREGDDLIITAPAGTTDRVALKDVEQRRQMNRSLMPESLEIMMSEPELLDLVAYLATLRAARGVPVDGAAR